MPTPTNAFWDNNPLDIRKDGSVAFTGDQPMGGFKLTGLGAGAGAGDSVRYEQLINVYVLLAGDSALGNIFRRAGEDNDLAILGGQNFAGQINLFGKDHATRAGQVVFWVPNTAKNAYVEAMRIGYGDTPGCTMYGNVYTPNIPAV